MMQFLDMSARGEAQAGRAMPQHLADGLQHFSLELQVQHASAVLHSLWRPQLYLRFPTQRLSRIAPGDDLHSAPQR